MKIMNFISCKPHQNFRVINSFNDVKLFDYKPLVICDIDHTFIRCTYDLEYFRKIVNYDYNIMFNRFTTNDDIDINKESIDLMNTAYNNGFVKQTDPDGFNNMLRKIEQLGGKFMFLTARGFEYHKKTINDLKIAGLNNPENFIIHYTNNAISKGEYIQKNNLINGYEHISFIDDYPSFISSVHRLFPQINCYLFHYN
jgi:hypothetical protein